MSDPKNDQPEPRTKADIARENGAKSRGPVTPEGKARSSLNAIRHGLTAGTVLLDAEAAERFSLMYEGYRDLWKPINIMEEDLVEEMAVCKWQERRIWSLESSSIDIEIVRQQPAVDKEWKSADMPCRTALAFGKLADDSHSLNLMLRYRNAINRQYHRALNQLLSLRAKKVFNDAPADPIEQPAPPPQPVIQNEPTPQPNSNITKEQKSSTTPSQPPSEPCCGMPLPTGQCALGRDCDRAKLFGRTG